MAASLTWRSLLPGLAVVATLTAIVIIVLAHGGIGRVAGDKTRLYVVTNQARGVMKGTDVWLEGQRVGTVQEVGFRAPAADTAGRVVLAIDVRADDAAMIRRDAEIRVRPGANLVGPVVVYVTGGTPSSPAARAGDTLYATTQSDVQDAGAQIEVATRNLAPIMADLRVIAGNVRGADARGTIGVALADRRAGRGAFAQLSRLGAQMDALESRFGGGTATSRLSALMASAGGAMARVDSIRTLLASPASSYGRFRRDSTLARSIAAVRDEVATLRARLAASDGTLDRFTRDSALTRSLAAAQQEMALLAEDVRQRPLRYIAF